MRDVFPGRRVSLDIKSPHLNDGIRLVFKEFDELSTVMSTTWIDLQKQKSESASLPAMNINQQLEVLKGWLGICEKDWADSAKRIMKKVKKTTIVPFPLRES